MGRRLVTGAGPAEVPWDWRDKESEKIHAKDRVEAHKLSNALKLLMDKRKRREEALKRPKCGRKAKPGLKGPDVCQSDVPCNPVSQAAPARHTAATAKQSQGQSAKESEAATARTNLTMEPPTHAASARAFPAATALDNKTSIQHGKAEERNSADQGRKRKLNGADERPDGPKKLRTEPPVDEKPRSPGAATVRRKVSISSERSERAHRRAMQTKGSVTKTVQPQKTEPTVGAPNHDNVKRKRADDVVRPDGSPDREENNSLPSKDASKPEHDQLKDDRPTKRVRLSESARQSGSKSCSTPKGEPITGTADLAPKNAENPRKRASVDGEEDGQKGKRSCSSDLRQTSNDEVPRSNEEPVKPTASVAADSANELRKLLFPDKEEEPKAKQSYLSVVLKRSDDKPFDAAQTPTLQKDVAESPEGSSSTRIGVGQSPTTPSGEQRSSAPTSPPTSGDTDQHRNPDQSILQPTGLHNFGNCCFANVVIQMLYRVYLDCGHALPRSSADPNLFGLSSAYMNKLERPNFDKAALKILRDLQKKILEVAGAANEAKVSITQSLFALFNNMRELSGKAVSPAVFQQIFAYMGTEDAEMSQAAIPSRPDFDGKLQQDPHEFLTKLMEDLHKERLSGLATDAVGVNRLLSTLESSSVTRTECTACGHVANTEETSQHYQQWVLPEDSQTVNIDHLINQLNEVEPLDGYTCDGCKRKSTCKKATIMTKLPKHLIVSVQRVGYHMRTGNTIKKTNRIDLPFAQFALESGAEKGSYEMVGLLKHNGGSADQGHYTSLQKYGSVWHSIDDAQCEVVTRDMPKTRRFNGHVYTFLFKKVENCNEQTSS